jgi:predicted GNAT family N-acyltransferase
MDLRLEQWHDDFLFSTHREKLDLNYIHSFLATQSYWASGVPREIVQRSIEHALCFGIYHHQQQIGFARFITDYATFGYLGDVFIDEQHRGRGLSKKLMEFIFGIEEFKIFRRMILVTSDAHGLYAQYGFKPLVAPDRYMELHRPNLYKKLVQD